MTSFKGLQGLRLAPQKIRTAHTVDVVPDTMASSPHRPSHSSHRRRWMVRVGHHKRVCCVSGPVGSQDSRHLANVTEVRDLAKIPALSGAAFGPADDGRLTEATAR